MGKIVIGLIAFGLLIAFAACNSPASTPLVPTPTFNPTPTLLHYVNKEFGYGIDYPKVWVFGQINPNEIGIGPKDSKYNQIQIGAFPGQPVLGSLSQSLAEKLNAAALQQWFDALGARNLNIIQNEPAQGKWDWMMVFTVIYEDTPLMGSYLIKETQSTTYTLVYLQVTGIDWPEGIEAISTFKLLP